MTPTFITGNANKAAILERRLGIALPHASLELTEIQSLDLEEVACCKAQEAFRIMKAPVLVEDVSLTFTSLNQLPGPFIKWFLETLGNPGLCTLLDGYADRSAVAKVAYCLHDGEEVHLFCAEIRGSIASTPTGEESFGWNSIFIPKGETRTLAEMDPEETYAKSMRPEALKQLKAHLSQHA